MRKKLTVIAAFCVFALCSAFSADPFATYTLSNGLTVFVKEDQSVAVTTIELALRAGYSSQTVNDAGIAPLYVRLVREQSGNSIRAACNADSATYAITAAPSKTEAALNTLAQSCIFTSFDDSFIQNTYETFSAELSAYEQTATGLINSAIDSRVFSQKPWKQDSGVYPAAFAQYSPEEIRTLVTMLRERLYVPNNAALFITTPLSADAILQMVQKQFGAWQKNEVYTPEDITLTKESKRKFVVTDDSFSEELTQIVVQFVTLSASQADTLSAAFNALQSPYTTLLLSDPLVALRSEAYLACSSTQRGGNARLILQALMEQPYSFAQPEDGQKADTSSASQAEQFVSLAKQAAHLTRRQLIASQAQVQASYKSTMGNSVQAMQVLCDFWAHDAGYGTGGFYERFLDMQTATFNLSHTELAQAVDAENPFVFVLINTKTYEAQKQAFDDAGWTLVTHDSAAWYTQRELKQFSQGLKDKILRQALNQQAQMYFADDALTDAQRFYAVNKNQFYSTTLTNGIPLTVKSSPDSQTVTVSLAIQGGELSSSSGTKNGNTAYLRTILVNAFATNIQAEINNLRLKNAFIGQTQIKAWTEETVSYITIQCSKEDLEACLTATCNAVVFGEITPVMADNLVYEQKAEVGQYTQSTKNQLKMQALSYLFHGTDYQRLYDTNATVLGNAQYNLVSLAYTQLLDAALYSIVMTGDIDSQTALTLSQKTFGALKEQTVRRPYAEVPYPDFSSGTYKAQLNHTFTTDMPAELASEDSPILIPTTEFSDPVIIFFSAPRLASERQVLNALVYSIANLMQKELEQTVTAENASAQLPCASVSVDAILHTDAFDSAYQSARTQLIEMLSKKTEQTLITDWIVQAFSDTTTNEGTAQLIQEGIRTGNEAQYLEDYLFLETLTQAELLYYAQTLLPSHPFTAYSKDSQR
ncbi:MAG: insulinase family protein [Treponema sp.]|nr:insulinase family protein [Treponema sp.]